MAARICPTQLLRSFGSPDARSKNARERGGPENSARSRRTRRLLRRLCVCSRRPLYFRLLRPSQPSVQFPPILRVWVENGMERTRLRVLEASVVFFLQVFPPRRRGGSVEPDDAEVQLLLLMLDALEQTGHPVNLYQLEYLRIRIHGRRSGSRAFSEAPGCSQYFPSPFQGVKASIHRKRSPLEPALRISIAWLPGVVDVCPRSHLSDSFASKLFAQRFLGAGSVISLSHEGALALHVLSL